MEVITDEAKMQQETKNHHREDELASITQGALVSPPKRITVWSALGVNYSATCAPIAILIFLSLTIGVGGTPVFIYSYIISVTMNMTVCISLAEMASSRPHSAGQMFWSAEFAPQKSARTFSYFTGFFAVGTWLFWYISAPLITAQLIMATVQVAYPDFSPEEWQIYIIYLGILVATYLWNIPLFSTLQHVNRLAILLINAGSLFIFISLLVRASPKQESRSIWLEIVNNNGWPTVVNFIISFLPGLNCVSGFDSSAHLAEEMDNPQRNVPIVMVGSAVLSGLTGFIMLVASAYCTTNVANLLDPVGGQPGLQLMKDSFKSLPMAVIGSIIFVIVLSNAATSLMTVNSRMIWAMSRQNGLPFSSWLSRLGNRTALPHNATIASVIVAAAVGALQLGSTVVVNAILGSAIICCNISYAIPIVLLLFSNDRKMVLGRPWFSLGSFGQVLNCVALVWLLLASVALSFPIYRPVTASNMNFASIVVGVMLVLATITWLTFSKRKYTIPVSL